MFNRRLDWLIDRIPPAAWGMLASLCTAIIIAVGQRPSDRIPKLDNFGYQDKVLHAVAYAGLASLIVRWLIPRDPRARVRGGLLPWLAIVLFPSLVGAADEMLQGLARRGRSADVWDWAADTLGALIVLGVAVWHRSTTRPRLERTGPLR